MENLNQLKQQLNVVFAGLFFGMISFAGVVIFVLKPEPTEDPIKDIYAYIAIALLVVGAVAGRFIASKRIPVIREMESEAKKRQAYTGICIVRYALIEGPVLASIVFLLLTGYDLFYYLIGGGLLYFLSLTPRKSFVEGELNITY